MNKSEHTYKKQTIECYLVIFFTFAIFFSVILIAGQMSGTNWIGYISSLTKEIPLNIIRFIR